MLDPTALFSSGLWLHRHDTVFFGSDALIQKSIWDEFMGCSLHFPDHRLGETVDIDGPERKEVGTTSSQKERTMSGRTEWHGVPFTST